MTYSLLPNPWLGFPTVGPFIDSLQAQLEDAVFIGDSPTFTNLTLTGTGPTVLQITDDTDSTTAITFGGDTTFGRTGPGFLATNGTLSAVAFESTNEVAATDVFITSSVLFGGATFQIDNNGLLQWADGTADIDTNLYRVDVNTLQTDSIFNAVGEITACVGVTGSTTIGAIGVSDQPGIFMKDGSSGLSIYLYDAMSIATDADFRARGLKLDPNNNKNPILWGTSLDTSLYRQDVNVLQTDGSLILGLGLSTPTEFIEISSGLNNGSGPSITINNDTDVIGSNTLQFVNTNDSATITDGRTQEIQWYWQTTDDVLIQGASIVGTLFITGPDPSLVASLDFYTNGFTGYEQALNLRGGSNGSAFAGPVNFNGINNSTSAGQVLIGADLTNGSLDIGTENNVTGQQPYIAFHFTSASVNSQAFNFRMWNDADGQMTFSNSTGIVARFNKAGNLKLPINGSTGGLSMGNVSIYSDPITANVLKVSNFVDVATGYKVAGTALAASNLSNGTSGSGSVVLSISPALTSTPTAPTATAGTNTTQIATTAFVQTALVNELDYKEFTSPVSITATTEATANTIVTADPIVFNGSTIALIEFFAPDATPDVTSAGRKITFVLYDGSTSLGQWGVISGQSTNPANSTTPLKRRLTPAAATKTYSVRAYVSAGTGTVNAGAGGSGVEVPGFIRITKVT